MRLSQLYSNQHDVFERVRFNDGLSVVLAEIRLPENQDLDVHNLGKSTIGELLDFCLLKGKSRGFFLYSEEPTFDNFVFFLELDLEDGTLLTLRRPVQPGTRVSFKRSRSSIDADQLEEEEWDELDLPFDKAKLYLEAALAFESLKPWPLRKLVGYLIRSQGDYQDVFQLGKFSGKHQDWKPFVAHLLGLDSTLVQQLYDKREELKSAEEQLSVLVREWGDGVDDPSLIDGLISVKRRDVTAREAALDSFDFAAEDQRVTEASVEDIERSITAANERRYTLGLLIQQLETSLENETIRFDPKATQQLFGEAGVAFSDDVQKTYDQLIRFNREIGRERRSALSAQLEEVRSEDEMLASHLTELNAQRAESLAFLRNSDTLDKYKVISKELSTLQAELATLEARRKAAARLADLRRQRRSLAEEHGALQTAVEAAIAEASGDDASTFGQLRGYFDEIVRGVLGSHAILSVVMNESGGLEFSAEFVGDEGISTSEGRGTTYRKLLCLAFDLAVVRSCLDVSFPRFVFHDGAFEQLEVRKQERLLGVLRQYAELGVQPVITTLERDLPDATPHSIDDSDVVLRLHDDGEAGRLFKMAAW